MGLKKEIEYIDMPEDVKNYYQYFTRADIEKLRKAGYKKNFTDIEEGIKEYIKYLNSLQV
jgi:ADP-L-glycero-D-manno-heptose 6-epimerase